MKYKHAILGGTGHIGSAIAGALLSRGEALLIIGHNVDKAVEWASRGAAFEVADINGTAALAALFRQAERMFILNPPAPPNTDTDAVERQQIRSVLDALKGCALEKIVAISAYGAQEGEHIFDLGSLYELEKGLAKLAMPVAVIRNAYYMTNLDQTLGFVKEKGQLMTVFPPEFKLAMVAPQDIGDFAAELMLDDRKGLFFFEGPERYSYQDVADTLGDLLCREVEVVSIPESGWHDFLIKGGFSEKAAASFMNMTKLTITQKFDTPDVHYGKTTLNEYLKANEGKD
jgi:uncharacterized protein YbjT (DUF2867 family)